MRKPGLFLLGALALAAAVSAIPGAAAYSRVITFSGETWSVKDHGKRKVGPGPNLFSASTSNVWVDTAGRLHLKITKSGRKYTCAEVVSTRSFGHGTYRWYLDSPVDNLDRYVVLGLFTWDDFGSAYNYREIDFEASRWGDPNNLNGQYVVQPYTDANNMDRFGLPANTPQSIHSFHWTPTSVFCKSLKGTDAATTDPNALIHQKTFTKPPSPVPPAGGENARMNLWLMNGHPPYNGQAAEVVISRFEFVPL